MSGGCRQLVGIEERSEQCGGLEFADSDCATCMDSACCAETTTCSSDDACKSAAEQLTSCGHADAACRITAAEAATPGNAALAELGTCRTTSCALACNGCGGFVDQFGAECDQCVQQNCCDLALACAGDQNCSKTYACVAACSTRPDCVAQCLQGPLRNDAVIAFQKCIQDVCYDACDIGQDWQCLLKGSWGPPTTNSSLTLDFKVVDFLSKQVVPNASVSPCDSILNTCKEGATTDANGVARLVLPVGGPNGWSGYFRVIADGYEEMLVGANKPFLRDDFIIEYVVKSSDLTLLLSTVKTSLDPNKSLLFVTALDCHGLNAPEIRFELSETDPGISPSYFQGPGSDPSKTAKIGTAAFANVPVTNNYLGVAMYLDDQLVGEDFVPLEPGTLTAWALFPKL